MVTYVMLMKLTAKGAGDVDALPQFIETLQEMVSSKDGTTLLACATLGAYDLVLAAELPDDGAAMILAADIAEGGRVSTETLKSFTLPGLEEMWTIRR
jgi:uncharacterized protein with GYD domain